MKTSCIEHPANEPLIIIRQWQIEFCDGNVTAAALMSFFEYWHNVKIDAGRQSQKANDVAAAHGEQPNQDTSLYQWHTEEELVAGIMHTAKSPKTVAAALALLVEKGVISIYKNPNPRFKFDKTRHFLFHPDVVNNWLQSRSGNITSSSSKNTSRQSKNTGRSDKNTPAIPETTTEITTEIGAAVAATVDGQQNGHPKEPDFLPDAETQMELLFAGRTAGSSQAYADAEQALMRSGWNIRKKEIKDAAVHFLAATGWEVPRDDGIRKDWIKQLNSHAVEFGTNRLYDLYREVFQTAKFDLSRPGSFTKAMSAIKNSGSSDRKHVKDDWTNDPQYQAFANQPEEEYIPWSTILNKS